MTRSRHPGVKPPLRRVSLHRAVLIAALVGAAPAAWAQTLTLAPEELETEFSGRAFDPLVTQDELERILDPDAKLDQPGAGRRVPASLDGVQPRAATGASGADDSERKQVGLGSSGD